DVQASDWLPGTLARLYGTDARGHEREVRIAIQEHVARKVGLHPGNVEVDEAGVTATSRHLPFSAFRVEVHDDAEGVVVRDRGHERPHFAKARQYWQERLGAVRWPVEDMYFAMAEKF